MIFVISIFELTKAARSALKVEKQVGSVYLLGPRAGPGPNFQARAQAGVKTITLIKPENWPIAQFINAHHVQQIQIG